jgi:hypothetical protein
MQNYPGILIMNTRLEINDLVFKVLHRIAKYVRILMLVVIIFERNGKWAIPTFLRLKAFDKEKCWRLERDEKRVYPGFQ